MSGGTWDHKQDRILLDTEHITGDMEAINLCELGELIYQTVSMIHDIFTILDYHIAGDAIIESLPEFEQRAINRIKETVKNG